MINMSLAANFTAAIHSDQTADYLSNNKIRLRLYKSNKVDVAAFLCIPPLRKKMEYIRTEGFFDFYEADLPETDKPYNYHFIIQTEKTKHFYNQIGLKNSHLPQYDFKLIPCFDVPNWLKGAVMYQIFVDRFYNGDTANDIIDNEYAYLGKAAKKKDWQDPVEAVDIANFYGGDLRGIILKLPYLKNLGVEVIYLNPIFVSPSSHKYDIQDYNHVDPHLGVIKNDGGDRLYFEKWDNKHATKYIKRVTDKENLDASDALFTELVNEAHRLDIRVILDGVFNHCGAFNKWMDTEGFYESIDAPGAFLCKSSPYHSYFNWSGGTWPNNDSYDSWWGHKNHPKLNFENSPELLEYILNMAKKWVSPPYNADGWRLDVAADLGFSLDYNIRFWQMFRDAVKSANPNAIIIAEHYGDPEPWLSGKGWDTVMNYDAFMEPVTWFLTGMQKHSENYQPNLLNNVEAFETAMSHHMARMPHASVLSAMNQLSNHDHSRFLTRTNKHIGRLHTHGRFEADINIDKNIFKLAVLIQMTWPGAPCIYYGDEAGMTGWTDPDNRRPYPWGNEDVELIHFHKSIIAVRNLPQILDAVRYGSLIYLIKENGVLCYARTLGNNIMVVAVNNTDREVDIKIPVWLVNVDNSDFDILFSCCIYSCNDLTHRAQASGGFLPLTIKPYEGMLLALPVRHII
ncbi:MAG: glycoside hydrolase family 13 protein [Defluviitaleaceae bacterium]|nr:glycoside hydrolase family 13 protein [Defluviitaleaceae bacterium]